MENNDRTKWINTVLHQMSKIEETQATTALENCGRECLKSSNSLENIKNLRNEITDKENTDLLFNTYKEKIYKNSPHIYKKGGDIYLEFQKCECGMVTNGGVTDPFLCNCTVGYTKQIFETLFGRPVKVKLMKSILNGDDICWQKISLTAV